MVEIKKIFNLLNKEIIIGEIMDFDERRIDLVKSSLQNKITGQRIITNVLDNRIRSHWPKEDEYLGRESVFDVMVCNNSNWEYEEVEREVIEIVRDDFRSSGAKLVDEDEEKITPPEETEEITIIHLKASARKDEEPLIDIALNNPEPHIRIAAVNQIKDSKVLCRIIKDDVDKGVKKACLNRLNELYVE